MAHDDDRPGDGTGGAEFEIDVSGERAGSNSDGGSSAPRPQSADYQIHLPEVDPDDLSGDLVVLEGGDGSGRSTQIRLLTEWLEWNGFAVQTMGLSRSRLLAEDIDEMLGKNEVRRLTLALLYATDFYDQLVHRIVPALRGGFVVLADRYVYTLVARAAIRGIERSYLENVYEFAVEPDVTFRLEVSPSTSFERLFEQQQAIDYWEAGGDLNLADSLYESFVTYQSMMREEFDRFAERWNFEAIDGEQSVPDVNYELRERLGEHLGIDDLSYQPSDDLLPVWNK